MWVLWVKCIRVVKIIKRGRWVLKERNWAVKRVEEEGFWWHKVVTIERAGDKVGILGL